MNAYTLGSLFSGIGGIDLAFQWANFDLSFQVEIDDYCTQVLHKHWLDVPRFGDIRAISGADLPHCDVLAGGFPCQDISVAGRGAGIRAGTRSGLWFEFARLIGELRPRVVLLENVAAITTRDGTIVIGQLAEMGYVGRFGLIRASDAAAPHQRERWFCVAYDNHRGYQPAHTGQGNDLSDHQQHGETPERQRHELEPGTGEHRQALADAKSAGDTGKRRTVGQTQTYPQEQDDGTLSNRGDTVVGHACREGLEKRPSIAGDTGAQQPPAERAGHELADAASGERYLSGRNGGASELEEARPGDVCQSRPVISGMGRVADGLPARLDGPDYTRWPARPGEAQHDWESPRTIASGTVPHRAARLKALGNAVVPQVVYPIACAIREWLEAQDGLAARERANAAVAR